MFFRIFICSFFFTAFFSAKALAVQAGALFWEIKKPGKATSSYLIGTKHDVILNEESLPPEVILALESSQVGLFEIISSENTEEAMIEAIKKRIRLPFGETLSLYIGEERAQRLFKSIQSALSRLSEDAVTFLSGDWKMLNVDITSYTDFNQLRPSSVIFMIGQFIQLSQATLEEEADKTVDDDPLDKLEEVPASDGDVDTAQTDETESDSQTALRPDIKTCLSRSERMDVYIEQTLFCMGNPVYSLESVGSQADALSDGNDDRGVAKMLDINFDIIIDRLEGRISELEEVVFELSSHFKQLETRVSNHVINSYHQNIAVDGGMLKLSVREEISGVLKQKQCPSVPETFINGYADHIVGLSQLNIQEFVRGKQIEEETKQKFARLMREIGLAQREIISSCFPDYIWPDNLEEQDESVVTFVLDFLQKQIESVLLSRDQKLAHSMLPYFERGKTFAAVGFAHLSGVLEELKAQGYEVSLIELSVPLRPAEDPFGNGFSNKADPLPETEE